MRKKLFGKLKIVDVGNFKIKDLDDTEETINFIRRKLR